MDPLRDLAVVVPVGPGDTAWTSLAADLRALPREAEVWLVATEPRAAALERPIWRWITAPLGRARQMNAGARATVKPFVWFLHADSRFTPNTLPALSMSLRAHPNALHYFDLGFLPDGPPLMPLNALGTRLRSRWGGMPFGDQGFCLPRALWERLGGFDVDAPYGEDHLFAWKTRRAAVPLRHTGGALRTSARKYRERGWLTTTTTHLRLTARQALPEWLALMRERV